MSSNFADSGPASPSARTRPIAETPAYAERAAQLLGTPQAMVQLDADDARQVVRMMRLVSFAKGTVLFREGDDSALSYLLLLLEGEVSVDSGEGGPADDAVAISVLGPGSIIGEMALLDGAPRSASCTALSTIHAAGLSRRGLELLIAEQPRVAAKLMVGLSQRLADRLRGLGRQIQVYAQLCASLRAELDRRG
ncbi:MAG: cyclic nucleotide-binding domain-containing protein [Burkholderiales bacterium]|nr:cyclic nucleotide-binding domain-containing protein [Burkholderiales bacterium]